MRKLLGSVCLLGLLTACSHDLTFINQKTGDIAKGTAHSEGGQGSLSVDLNGSHYTGRWVYVRSGGLGVINTFGPSPGLGMVAFSGGGGGVANLTAGQGKTLRCEFQYSDMSGKGMGLCRDEAGNLYDLHIS